MKTRRASGFTIIEILIVVFVLAILTAIVTIGYGNIRKTTLMKAAQSDLQQVATAMERALQKTNTYPTELPETISVSGNINLEIAESGAEPYYDDVSEVQNGVLFADICAALVSEGVGKGVNQGGVTEDYITGCGNWNHDSMQFTGWNTKLWNVPVNSTELLDYAQTFTTNNSWNKTAHEGVVKNFYTELVERFERQGGYFPITSFWDYWATSTNGGVQADPLPTDPKTKPFFCAEAQVTGYPEIIWHITQENKLKPGRC